MTHLLLKKLFNVILNGVKYLADVTPRLFCETRVFDYGLISAMWVWVNECSPLLVQNILPKENVRLTSGRHTGIQKPLRTAASSFSRY
jgi:hypothetical protein